MRLRLMKFSVFLVISVTTFSLLKESLLDERFLLQLIDSRGISGLGERFVDVTGGDEEDCTSESFSFSLMLLLFVNKVIDRLIKLNPDVVEDDDASFRAFVVEFSADVNELAASVCLNHGKS